MVSCRQAMLMFVCWRLKKCWEDQNVVTVVGKARVKCCDGAQMSECWNVPSQWQATAGSGRMLRRRSNVGTSECTIAVATGQVECCNGDPTSERRNAPSPWQATARAGCCNGNQMSEHRNSSSPWQLVGSNVATAIERRNAPSPWRPDVVMAIKRRNVGIRCHHGNGSGQMLQRRSNVGMSECAIAVASNGSDRMLQRRLWMARDIHINGRWMS